MRHIRIIFSALLACGLAAVFASAASAALPEFSPTSNTFKLESGKGELGGALKIKCGKDKTNVEGKVTGAKTISVTVDFEECEVLTIKFNSEGDAAKSGIILAPATGELCYLKGSTKAAPKVGLYTTVTGNLKVEGGGVKGEVKGSVIGEATPVNGKKSKTGVDNYVTPNPSECFPENEGKGTAKKHTLESKTGSGSFEKAEEKSEEKVTYVSEQELKA